MVLSIQIAKTIDDVYLCVPILQLEPDLQVGMGPKHTALEVKSLLQTVLVRIPIKLSFCLFLECHSSCDECVKAGGGYCTRCPKNNYLTYTSSSKSYGSCSPMSNTPKTDTIYVSTASLTP